MFGRRNNRCGGGLSFLAALALAGLLYTTLSGPSSGATEKARKALVESAAAAKKQAFDAAFLKADVEALKQQLAAAAEERDKTRTFLQQTTDLLEDLKATAKQLAETKIEAPAPPTPANTPAATPAGTPAATPPAPAPVAVAKPVEMAPVASGGEFITAPAGIEIRVRPPTAGKWDDELQYDFARTAIVTMASGNDAARMVITLVHSLRDTKTRAADIIVMLSRGGQGSPECRGEDGNAWKKANKREHIHHCGGPETIAEEIISPRYVETLKRMGAIILVVDEIPSTIHTYGIPGGRGTFWGMALNKLRVFNMTQYKKAMWMDGDTLVLKNVDHLFKEPTFTGSFTHACCNARAPAIPSGGLWVFEPSEKIGSDLWKMMAEGKPSYKGGWGKDVPDIDEATGKQKVEYWHWGDMQIVRWYFSKWPQVFEREPLWPHIDDDRHGHVVGLRNYPAYKDLSEAEFKANTRDSYNKELQEGFIGTSNVGQNEMGWDGIPVWHALDARFDQCMGNCDCMVERVNPAYSYTVHFSCIQGLNKPGTYTTDKDFGDAMMTKAPGCSRFWMWHTWYLGHFVKAHGRYDAPLYEGPSIPAYDDALDAQIKAGKLLLR